MAGHPGEESERVLHAPHRRRMPTGTEIEVRFTGMRL